MNIQRITLNQREFPEELKQIPTPPKQLFVAGNLQNLLDKPRVAVVGSRKMSPYGKQATDQLARELARRGLVIVSGLAFGVDITAHKAALEVGALTMAVLPSSLEAIYPASHRQIARHIVESGGVLVSEYPAGTKSFKGNFVARNRLIAGLSQAVLISEAALKSGSLHTARFALEQGRDVLAVPGNITSPASEGANNLIKAGAAPVTSYEDVLHVLGIKEEKAQQRLIKGSNEQEQIVLDLLLGGLSDGEELQKQSGLDIAAFNQTLTMLEISGHIRSQGANHWSLR